MFALDPVLEGANWRYKPSGFFANQREHGAIPVVLTMLSLVGMDEDEYMFAPPTNVSIDAVENEVDLIAVHRTRWGPDSTAIVVGECKGGQQQIASSDLEALARIVR